MKHKLTLAASIVVVAGAAVLAVHTHRDAIHQITLQNAVTAAQNARQAALEKAQEAADAAKAKNHLDQLEQNCQRGLDAYRQLTPSQQKRMAEPVCSLQ